MKERKCRYVLKKIIGNTVIFVVMIGLIVGFSAVFGSDNTLIGVTTITAVFLFLSKDFSLNPIKTAIKLICFNIAMGIITFWASENPILGIPLNFISLFIMGYTLSYNLSSPSFVPFNLQYVFLLSTPITIDKLPKRLLSLAVGAVIIILSQVLLNKNKIYKQGNSLLSKLCLSIIDKIEFIENNKNIDEIDKGIKGSINKFRRFIYNKREQEFYLTNEGRIKLNISLELEKINDALNELAHKDDAVHILSEGEFDKYLIKSINILKSCLDKDENLENLNKLFDDIFKKYDKEDNMNVFTIKILNSLFFIRQYLYDLKELDKKKYNMVSKLEDIPSNFRLKNIYKESFRSNSLKFSYAFRLALGVTFSAFIVEYFNISEGRWILYTVNTLIQPFYEKAKEKTKDRLIGTIIGAAIIVVVFYFIKDSTARSIAIMFVGYLASFNNSYKFRTINITVSAIGMAAVYGDAKVLTIDRLVFVCIGILIALFLNKFVLPYREKDAKEYLIKLYNDTILSQINIVKNFIEKGKSSNEAMKNEILRANMIEERILSNEKDSQDENLNKYLDSQRLLLLNISDLYRWLEVTKINVKPYNEEKNNIKNLFDNKDVVDYSKVQEIIDDSKSNYSLSSKIAIIDYIEILVGLNRMKKAAV